MIPLLIGAVLIAVMLAAAYDLDRKSPNKCCGAFFHCKDCPQRGNYRR